jgi:hypothetical protein
LSNLKCRSAVRGSRSWYRIMVTRLLCRTSLMKNGTNVNLIKMKGSSGSFRLMLIRSLPHLASRLETHYLLNLFPVFTGHKISVHYRYENNQRQQGAGVDVESPPDSPGQCRHYDGEAEQLGKPYPVDSCFDETFCEINLNECRDRDCY